ncbi:Arm DNA-binding domain-containing protein [Microbacterium timonense]|uniref:Arm DNA-binding domain-containing protein n=1 Tax=Microbacterium timonense TaxID=2086576 RepID=UPI001F4125EC|nr:tyrosine-type recombinase/integrase [Microbacterium timonense]
MGSIAAYQAAAGCRYRVRWRDDTTHRQVEKRGFKTKRDAELFLARRRSPAPTVPTRIPRRPGLLSASSAPSGCETSGTRSKPRRTARWRRRGACTYSPDGHDEVVRLAEAASTSTYRTLILVLAYCGLRWSEAIGMHVRDINFERDRIQVNRAAVEVEGRIASRSRRARTSRRCSGCSATSPRR